MKKCDIHEITPQKFQPVEYIKEPPNLIYLSLYNRNSDYFVHKISRSQMMRGFLPILGILYIPGL